jgi:hypothetical protein
MGSKVKIRFKVSVIENACLVGRAVDLMTNDSLRGTALYEICRPTTF